MGVRGHRNKVAMTLAKAKKVVETMKLRGLWTAKFYKCKDKKCGAYHVTSGVMGFWEEANP